MDEVINTWSELSITRLQFQEQISILNRNIRDLKRMLIHSKYFEPQVLLARLQNGVMNFRMIPISTLLERFPGLVRDTARQANKKVKLEIIGGETELDRLMINSLADPLIHILRNSIDHGIETDQERLSSGKPEIGLIKISAYYMGSYAVVEISDDGRGINKDRLIAKAIERGITTEEKQNY